ncbi:hypothetical protein L202_01642 [Cryptococcus amylolentus CBS 6039]|uniref:Uncharacterized protein n=2 Tax=Cryptococcus amylolentus TaxID=104669 RepID=A0A1E3I4R8_9TREE|nr:hypothetical protein L202_01642 [Cryptococcus amylolentus CBS 6039]ODN83508.1 hypothetical protein L202_01642 [Cryptococcus amylolentus CBS 6039]ODO11023.1 hypothetical protein I350_01623 [Cryptococcus amylolentus CBS 6273]
MYHDTINYSTLPKEYLQSYPYPAFVLLVPIPPPQPSRTDSQDEFPTPRSTLDPSSQFTRSDHGEIQPFEIVWGNEKWTHLFEGRPLLDCLDVDGVRRLGNWISGASTPTLSPTQKTFPSLDNPVPGSPPSPENFWSAEHPYEDRSPRSDGLASDHADLTGIEPFEKSNPGPATLEINLINPGRITLELTKTLVPVLRDRKGSENVPMRTHSFVVITSTPRTAFVPNAPQQVSHHDVPPAAYRAMLDKDRSPIKPKEVPSETVHPYLIPKTTILSPSPSVPTSLDPSIPRMSTTPHPKDDSFSSFGELRGLGLLSPAQNGKTSKPLMFNVDGTISRQADTSDKKEHASVDDLMASTDWTKTPLGPREQWPQSLKTIVALVMNYPHQCCLWWGRDLTLIYNEPYAKAIHKHPSIFGMSGPSAWSEIWSSLGPISEIVLAGTPVWKEDDFLLFRQLAHQGDGVFEEYHTWMWVPILQEDGTFGGLWNATIRTTKKVLAERRMVTVREMGQRTAIARTMEEFDKAVVDILENNPRDAPFAALYHVDQIAPVKMQSRGTAAAEVTKHDPNEIHVNVSLVGSVGIPENHPSTPSNVSFPLRHRRRSSTTRFSQGDISSSPALSMHSSSVSNTGKANLGTFPRPGASFDSSKSEGHPAPETESWPLREALQCRRLVLVEDVTELIKDFNVRVWDELPSAAVVVPISSDSDEEVPNAVLVLGLNIRRPFDEDYESWIVSAFLRLQLASGIAAVHSYEVEHQRLNELAAIDRAKSLLFSNVSHELRTPLTLIAGPIDDLLLEAKDNGHRDMLLMVRRNMRRLARLVSTLMDVSRLEAGRLRATFRPVNIGTMTSDLAVLFKRAIEKAKLQYTIEVDNTPENAFVDPEHWEKIVFNLIGNAMKYTMSGFVHVKLHYVENQIVFEVKDSGVGIPRSDIHLIGERFHRVQSVSRSHEGTGIGLSLVKELINLHGGSFEIESVTEEESEDRSHGSTFRVRIPLGCDHLPYEAIDHGSMPNLPQSTYGEGLVDEAMQWVRDNRDGLSANSSDESSNATGESGGGTQIGSGGTGVSGLTSAVPVKALDPNTLYFEKSDIIMLVEDSSDTRRYMKSIFAQYCTVVEARDGREALELCAKQKPNLIISDVMMPHVDGFELLTTLKDSSEFRMIPVIMLTARGADESKVSGIMAGAEDYLAKPFNAREIVARAHMQLQLGKKRKHLEEAFEERTAELRVLSEFSPVGIFRADENGKLTFVNSTWYSLSGFPTNKALEDWQDIIPDQERDELNEFWFGFLTSGERTSTRDWRYKNGKWSKYLECNHKSMLTIAIVTTDITERKIHEQTQHQQVVEAEQRRLDAEEAKRQQELLIDITSHELRNPISSMMQMSLFTFLYTNLLSLQEQLHLAIAQQKPFNPTRQLMNNIDEDLEALESIYQCGLTQERISNDVLSLGRIQLDMLEMFDVEFDLWKEAQNILSIFQNEARMKRIKLSFKAGESHKKLGLTWVKADLVRLNQIVTNLLSNAIRFTATSAVRQVELRSEISFDPPEDDTCTMPREPTLPKDITDDMTMYLYLEVADTGPGLTENEVQKLFQRFSQVSPKTHTVFGGSGLGLFVCRSADSFSVGGGITVVSEKGKGSTFRWYIKAKTCHTVPQTAANSLRAKLKASRDAPRYFGLTRNPHVLIVEDNLINQTVLARQLKHCNLTCDVASNGLEALEKIRKASSVTPIEGQEPVQCFDCVLMDLEMPVMDGLTAVQHIREEEAAGLMKKNLIIALTGNARQGQIDEARARGMDEIIIKPYRLDDLLRKIEDMMKIRADDEDAQMALDLKDVEELEAANKTEKA